MGVLLYMVSMRLNVKLNIKVNEGGTDILKFIWLSSGHLDKRDRDKVKYNWNDPFCEHIHKGL